MPAEFIQLHTHHPDKRRIQELAKSLIEGDVLIIPTDSVYALVCHLNNKNGMDRICRLLGKKPGKADLSLLCRDMSEVSNYCRQIPNAVFKLMKHVLPGPFTFILTANNSISKLFQSNKKTVGIRVPDSDIVQSILNAIESPLVSSSIHSEDEIQDYLTEPEEIYEVWQHKVDFIIDGGAGSNIPSTVIDCTGDEPVLIREGLRAELL
ncbi:MAG: threonylcarbamoyl-AMP synthase [Bacteroidetes bacterium]|nr:threonylcarbamoyl-AMP synthase [Bacteroidota bacterium]